MEKRNIDINLGLDEELDVKVVGNAKGSFYPYTLVIQSTGIEQRISWAIGIEVFGQDIKDLFRKIEDSYLKVLYDKTGEKP